MGLSPDEARIDTARIVWTEGRSETCENSRQAINVAPHYTDIL